MSLRHLALVRLQDTEMALYVLKRSGDFLCLSSPLSLLPFFDDCQRAIQDSAVIGNGAFYRATARTPLSFLSRRARAHAKLVLSYWIRDRGTQGCGGQK